ncbi:MAG: hypothetical protein K0R34_794 [Herbinix sp.]|jgi:hypothetical protein|nr:hypothetical protein [Herbinix sp.]
MQKIKLILFLLIIITITGCSGKDVNRYYHDYRGKSELWDVYYYERSALTFWTEDGTLQHDTTTEVTFTAVYKNNPDDLSKIHQLEIGYETGLTGSSMCEYYDEGGPDRRAFTITSSSGLVANETDTITATIQIDDHTETIVLTEK